ncbi:MAG: hypothetical protein WA359_03880 [Acidimicrobiales bacterium]
MKKIRTFLLSRLSGVARASGPVSAAKGGRVSGEDGAILILAFTYLVAVGLVVALLSTWATNDLNNSTKFSSANSLTLAATNMTNTAIQYIRYNPTISTSQPIEPYISAPVACWGGTSTNSIPTYNGYQIAVWCTTAWNPKSLQTRDVIFYACPITVSAASCSSTTQPNALLTVEVYFDDYPTANSPPILDLCSAWCGSGMTIESWKWGSSASGNSASAAAKLQFTNEPSDTSVGIVTDASVTVTDSSGNPVEGDTVTIDGVAGISATQSTLSVTTNADGVAEFTNLYPDTAESSVVLTARDGSLSTTSSSFAISIKKSVIQVLSAAPNNATQGGAKYSVSASASSGDAVGIGSSATPTVCAVSGVTTAGGITSGSVSFTNPGTCTLTFTDSPSGNPNFGAAVPVTQSFSVGGLTATQVAIVLGTSTPAVNSSTNDSISMTLENAVGVPVNSVGTTTVVLSDIGNGEFATTNGATGASSLSVSFANGKSTAVAYFGDPNLGPDTISAFNGTTNWGSATLTVEVGPASQVLITPVTTTPAVSSTTNTALAFQLEDQQGDPVTSSGTTTLALSASGSGFFAASNGSTGALTLSITFADGVGTAMAYFGDESSGTVMLTAKNGANVWGTSTLTPVAGAATSVQISLSPTPVRSTRTNTEVTLQLVDQYGNPVLTGGVAFTLSNSGSGFFATRNGVTGTATLSITTNASGVASGYFGDNATQTVTITATSPGISVTTPPFAD